MYTSIKYNRYESAISKLHLSSSDLRQTLVEVTGRLRSSRSNLNFQDRVIWDTSVNIIGPAFFFFSWWLLKKAAALKVDRVYFLSRDGEIFLKITQLIKERQSANVDLRYLYGSRHLWLIASLEKISREEIKWLFSDWWYALSVRSICKRLSISPEDIKDFLVSWGFPQAEWEVNLSSQKKAQLKKHFQEPAFVQAVVTLLQATYKNTLEYLLQSGVGDAENLAIADIGWRGRPQVSLNKILKRGGVLPKGGIKGFYFGSTEGKEICPGDAVFSFLFDLSESLKGFHLRNNHLYESFAASQEGKIVSFQNNFYKQTPVLSPSNQAAITWGIPLQQEGILSFTRAFLAAYPLESLNESDAYKILKKVLYLFIIHPSQEEARVYGSFPMDGEVTESNAQEIAPVVTRKQFWALCFNLKKFNLFWVQASLKRSRLWMEEKLWSFILPVVQVGFYCVTIPAGKIFRKSQINSLFKIFDRVVSLWNYVLEQNKSVEFVKNVKSTFGVRIFIVVCNMISAVLTARVLGPEGRGEYSVALALSMMGVYVSLLGLNASNTHFVAKEKTFVSHYISNNFFFSFIVGLLTILAILAIQFLFPGLILIDSKMLLMLSLLWIPLSLMNILSQSLLLGMGDVRKFNKIESIAPLVGVLGIVTMILLQVASVKLFFACLLFGQLAAGTLALRYLKPFTKDFFGSLSLKLLKENLLYGLKALYFPSIFIFLLLSIDLLMIKCYLGEKSAGYYSIATSIANLLFLLPGVISILLFAKLSAVPDKHTGWNYTVKAIKWFIPPMLLLLTFAFVFAEPLILLFFGGDFQPSVNAFIWLIPAVFLNSVATILLNYFAAAGMWGINVYSTLISVIVNIMLNLKLIPCYGIVGASYAACISYGGLLCVLILYKTFNKAAK